MRKITQMGVILALNTIALNSFAVPITAPTEGLDTFSTATGLRFSGKGNVLTSGNVSGAGFLKGAALDSIVSLYDFDFDSQPKSVGKAISSQDSSGVMFKVTSASIEDQGSDFSDLPVTGVPEPSTLGLLGLGFLGIWLLRKNKHN